MSDAQLPPLKLAYFSPLPPARSGIADYSYELLPHLGRLAKITLFADQPDQVSEKLQAQFPVKSTADFPAGHRQYDLALYQMGNSRHHAGMYPLALDYPGVVVLHDYGLHHFLADTTIGQDNYPAYAREMGYALGPAGIHQAWEIRQGRQPHPLFEQPLNARLIDRSLAIVVHSQHVAGMIRQRRPERPVATIPAIMSSRSGHSQRPTLGLSPETVIFASIGLVTNSKRLDLALRAFAQLRDDFPQSHYLIVGEVKEEVNLPALIEELGLLEAITCTGYEAKLDTFIDWTSTADVIVNLRQPTAGETSAAALRAMAAGRPLIVFDHGWYSELPAEAAIKIPVGDEEELLAAMRELANDSSRRQKMGQHGRDHVAKHHNPEQVATRYAAFLNRYLVELNQRLGQLQGPEHG